MTHQIVQLYPITAELDFKDKFTENKNMSGQPLSEPSSSEQDERGAYELHRMRAVAGKGPIESYFDEEEEMPCEIPNLEDYFNEFLTPVSERIRICRSYASYLSSLKPKKKRRKRSEKEEK